MSTNEKDWNVEIANQKIIPYMRSLLIYKLVIFIQCCLIFSSSYSRGSVAMNTSILLIDDNAISLKLVGEILEMEGFSVTRSVDAESALIAINQSKPDLILLDIGLPGMSGLELTHRLKEEEATKFIKIIALTAFAMSEDRERAMAAGCDGYITKPIDIRKFTAEVKTYLDRNGA